MGETPGEDVIYRAAAERGRLRGIVAWFWHGRHFRIFQDFSIIIFLACRHIPYLSNYVSFTAVVEVGAEHCEET
jgi:hypothetical protein